MDGAEAAAVRFNEMINAGDVDGLESLTDGHSFVDTGGHAVSGTQACREVWSGFFAAYPTYRNVFTSVQEKDAWSCRGGPRRRVAVHDDTPDGRRRLGIAW